MLDYVISRVFCFIAIRFMHSSKILKWIERYLYTVLLFNYSSEGHMLNMETWLHILVDLLMLYWTVTCAELIFFFTIAGKCKGHFFFCWGRGMGYNALFWGVIFLFRDPLYTWACCYYLVMTHWYIIWIIIYLSWWFSPKYYIYLKIFHFLCQTFSLM